MRLGSKTNLGWVPWWQPVRGVARLTSLSPYICFERRSHAAFFIIAKASLSMNDGMLKITSWTVTMWHLWEHGVEVLVFVVHFINLFNTTVLMPCTGAHSEAPMSHFLNRRVCTGFQTLIFWPIMTQNVTHAHLFTKCTTHLKPQPRGKPPRSGSDVPLDKTDPACFSN